MKKTALILVGILSASVFAFAGCKEKKPDDSSTQNSQANVNIVDSALTLDCFETYTLEVELENTEGISWSSSDPSILSVDENGRVTANIKTGKATVIAKSGEASDSCEVTVLVKSGNPVLQMENSVFVSEGGSYTVAANAYYNGIDISEYLTFGFNEANADAETIAQAEMTGNRITFKGNSVGNTAYTVYTTIFDALYAETVDVTVNNTDLVYVVKGAVENQLQIKKDNAVYTSDVEIYYKNEKVDNDSLDWTIADETVATIGDDGRLLMGKEGVTTLSTAYGGSNVSVEVRVIKEREYITVEQTAPQDINLNMVIMAELISYPTSGERHYAPNETQTASFALADESHNGSVVRVSVDGEELDVRYFSFAGGVVTMETKAFGTEIYGEKTMVIEVEDSETVSVYTLKALIVTKIITNLTDFKTAIVIQWQGDKIFGYYVLGCDIDFNWYELSVYATNWVWTDGFRGTLDGRGYSIINFKTGNYGITAQIGEGAVFKNIKFPNVRYNGGETTLFGRGVVGATFDNIEITTTADSSFARSTNDKSVGLLISHEMRRCTFKNITIHAEGKNIQRIFGGMGNEQKTSTYENIKVYASSVESYEYNMTTAPAGVELIVG